MLRFLISLLLTILCFVLQSTVFTAISFAGVVPNLMVILTASFGFMRGERSGMLFGFFCGLLADIFFGTTIGLYALIYLYIGYFNGKFNRIFYPDDIRLPLFLILCSDLSYGLLCYVLFFLLRGKFHFGYYLVHVILPEAVYTIAVTLLLYPLVLWINKKLENREQRSVKKFV